MIREIPPNPNPHHYPRLLLKAREAAQALAISERLLWKLTDQGDIPCVRIGRSVRYDVQDLEAWIESKKACSGTCGIVGVEQ
jgi:excisionase family DNA binding protein